MHSGLLVVCIASVAVVGPAVAGSLGISNITPFMDWDPDCRKPFTPSFYVHDVDSYNFAVAEFNGYVSEVENYMRCLEREAQSDLDTVTRAIQNGLDDKQDDAVNEVDQLRNDLERQALFLQ